ncbi:hypothetical protein DMB95_01855 [Campylobacter sp. MIT 12-8780]|uniref:DUF6150 family protein n=1 Tax=unclassified Campylobacter TaxID=2593542 RepID=UPI00115D958E|nr:MULTISPECIES: DUF6150 family protein [unclassified Campylobacter]NDJ26796.1 hypothetical protein [Campylobacter sp. MIT 19-121]TQR42383.1 hypothetical protein DMB95_01855 [Campylobacter sp. MIT 12-8780]
MAKIFVKNTGTAKIKCCEVTSEHRADILVYVVDKDYKAKNDALWFYTDNENSASSTITWVKNESSAQLKVMFVDKDYKAKWKSSNQFRGRL